MPGGIKDKLKSQFKKLYIGYIDSLLKGERIKNKYAVSYSLNYIRENGVRFTVSKIVRLIKNEGFQSLSRTALRKRALAKLTGADKLLQPVGQVVDIALIKDASAKLAYRPKISIIVPVYNTKPGLLRKAIESVKSQVYENWELCITDDCSTHKETRDILERYQNEPGINVRFLERNAGISEASNAALELTTGEFIALMDHDDEITPDALYWIVNMLNEHNEADILYSDECKVDEQGNLSDYFLKPGWSPELLFNMMYIGHLTVYRKKFLLEQVGRFRKEFDFSQDYDLALRATEKTSNIHHVDKVIYHWRLTEGSAAQGDKPYARASNLAALADAAKRRNINADVIALPVANRLKIRVDGSKKVSLVIPTDSYSNLKEAIEHIVRVTSYANYEIVPVTNTELIKQMKELFSDRNISYAVYDKPYNFSDKCNTGAAQATGEIVIFFNDDVRPLESDWIENTIEFLELPGVGGVSPKLVYENDTIQYAGMATGVRNLTGTTFHCYPRDSTGYLAFPQLVRNVSILSGACMAMRKELFVQLGGFDAVNTPSSHSDVDLSFRIMEAGYRCVYTPYACLRHIGHLALGEYEKKTPGSKKDKADIFLLKQWVKYLSVDKYFTAPMKRYLYHDSPQPFHVHAPAHEREPGKKGDVLLVSHELSLSGAPIMLYHACKDLIEKGYFVVVCCETDGPLRQMYQNIGVTVIIDDLLLKQHPSFGKFAKHFDYMICNTVVTWPVVRQMHHVVKTMWWIHEGQVISQFTKNADFVSTLKEAKYLVGVSDYNISYVKPYNKNIRKIYNACFDVRDDKAEPLPERQKVVLSLVGSVEKRKGHDVLIAALEKMPSALLQQMEVWVAGRVLEQNFFNRLSERINKLGVIRVMGEKSHEECLELMKQSDVILNVSRDDPFPLVLVEALCLGKACLVSTNSGLAELIVSGENGYVFRNEDAADLANKLMDIVRDKKRIKTIGERGRQIYEQHLTIDQFKQKVEDYMESIV